MGVYNPRAKMPNWCGDCDSLLEGTEECEIYTIKDLQMHKRNDDCPLIEIVRCGECKHKPIKHDPEGDEYGFNLVSPNGYDNLCPCLNTDDGFYSYMPDDNFFCAFGERRADGDI